MNNLDLYQYRLTDGRSLSQKRHRKIKEDTFKNALQRSYNSVNVERDGERFKALITGIPTSPIITKKNFATLLKEGCEVGDTIYWEEHDSHWIITEHDSTEMAIFQGSIQQCIYEIMWQDPKTNEIYTAWAAAKGPEETTITNGVKHSIFFDRLTDSLYLIIPQKTPGAHLLKRYFKLMVAGRKWEVEIVDDITRTELLFLDLKEISKDKHVDSEELVEGQLDKEFSLKTSLDLITEASKGLGIHLDPVLMRKGRVIKDYEVSVRTKGCENKNQIISFNEVGEAKIIIEIEEINFRKDYTIEVVENSTEEIKVELVGPKTAKTFETIEFKLMGHSGEGNWTYDKDYFTLVEQSNNKLVLKAKNKTGTSIITTEFEEEILAAKVKMVPLFGGV